MEATGPNARTCSADTDPAASAAPAAGNFNTTSATRARLRASNDDTPHVRATTAAVSRRSTPNAITNPAMAADTSRCTRSNSAKPANTSARDQSATAPIGTRTDNQTQAPRIRTSVREGYDKNRPTTMPKVSQRPDNTK